MIELEYTEKVERIFTEASAYFISKEELIKEAARIERKDIDTIWTGGGPLDSYIEEAYNNLLKSRQLNVLFNRRQILDKVGYISNCIEHYVSTNNIEHPTLLCVLDGGFRFYSDLISTMRFPMWCDFIKISSYTGQKSSDPKIHKFPKYPTKDRDIIIIDDIYDSGNTLNYLLKELRLRNPKSLAVATLLHRSATPKPTEYPYFSGFDIGTEWVAGYGLDDLSGTSRNLNYIYEIPQQKI